MTRRKWTPADQRTLDSLWQQGFDDKSIAYMMGRYVSVVRRWRVRMGAKANGKHGPRKGWKHTPEACAKISAAQYRRWQQDDGGLRRKIVSALHTNRKVRPRTIPQPGDPNWLLYRKLRQFMPREQALQEVNR